MFNEENTQEVDLENNEDEVTEETTETTVEDETIEETTDWEAEAKKQAAETAKWKAIAQRNKNKPQQPINKPKDNELAPLKETVQKLELAERKRQFGFEHGLSPDETDAIFRINPNPTKDDLDNPFVKGGLDALRAKKRVENGTPSPSSGSPKFNGKSFAEMTPEERQKNWGKIMKR